MHDLQFNMKLNLKAFIFLFYINTYKYTHREKLHVYLYKLVPLTKIPKCNWIEKWVNKIIKTK
jgi:hypothetical protein